LEFLKKITTEVRDKGNISTVTPLNLWENKPMKHYVNLKRMCHVTCLKTVKLPRAHNLVKKLKEATTNLVLVALLSLFLLGSVINCSLVVQPGFLVL